jgi:uncharacterized protein YcbX
MAMNTLRLRAIWRYPVKSLQGEELTSAAIETDGLAGDRGWGIRDDATGRILTARREPQLLLAAATLGPSDEPVITLPDGQSCTGAGPKTDALLSDWLAKPVTLVRAAGAVGAKAEFFADATDDTSRAIEWTMPAGRFVDAMPLLVLTTASLRAAAAAYPGGDWEVRRFRPNLLVESDADGWVEDSWFGRVLRIGDVEIAPREPCVRCTMVTRPQPGLERDLDIYKTLSRHHGGTFGMWTAVVTSGTIAVGDAIS